MRMNHCVPDFETDEDYLIPASSSLTRHQKSTMGGDEDIMELLWQNGQVVAQSQNQRSIGSKRPETTTSMVAREIRSGIAEEETPPPNLFMQEDEMASWLHYPIDDNSLDRYLYTSNDLLYNPTPPSSAAVTTGPCSLPPPPPPSVTVPSHRPPIPPPKRLNVEPSLPRYPNFLHFSRPNKERILNSAPSSSSKKPPPAVKQTTVVESNETPAAEALESRASRVSDATALVSGAKMARGGSMNGVGAADTSSMGRELETCDLSATSSPITGGSGASASMEPSSQKPPPSSDDRKRKGAYTDDTECHSEDVEFECVDTKKQSDGSTSTKRSRAAEVHNLSERRRRDRINEKMKALQELIPRCNKSDKASMLDEAIEYLKSLQLQVQMMSMGCSMVPMMFPGVQQYMPPMAMGMGMGMDMGMNRPMVPYPAVLPGSNPAAAAAHLSQRFPVAGFHMPQVPVAGPARSQAANLSAPMMSPFPPQNPNQQVMPNFADPYQQYLGLHQTQLPLPQSQAGVPPIAIKPSSSEDIRDHEHHKTG